MIKKNIYRIFLWLILPLSATASPRTIEAGFSTKIITPEFFETWEDTNKNAKKDKNEPYTDANQNGKFDAIYLAGFGHNRPAKGVHDDLYAIASVFKSGPQKMAFITIDAIGFMIDEVDDVRKMIKKLNLGIDHVVVHSLHNHSSPDTQGLWGPALNKSGINSKHMLFLKRQMVAAVVEADENIAPVDIHYASILGEDYKFGVVDIREPQVVERGIKSVIFTEAGTRKVRGSWVQFSNHVETIWNKNLYITADWPGYLRKSLNKLGGVTSVFVGNIGGLATTLPETPVFDMEHGRFVTGANFKKVMAQGNTLASVVKNNWNKFNFIKSSSDEFSIESKRFDLRVRNKLFILANRLGIIHRNMKGTTKIATKTEMNMIRIGPMQILTIPGELYPEIAVGGIVNLPGTDFDVAPVEIPPLYDLMNGEINMMFNLTNDSVGYIIPYTEWDVAKPYLNHEKHASYGEENSIGKDTSLKIYENAKILLK